MARAASRVAPWIAIAATAGLGAACLAEALGRPAAPFPGFLTYQSGAVAALARAEWPGFRAGLAVRDVIVAVDGVPVDGGAALGAHLATLREGSEVAVTALTPDGATKRARVRLSHLGRADLGYTFALPFSIGLLYLLLGGFIFVVKRDLATALTLALCLVASAFYLTMFDAHTAYRFTRTWVCYPMLGPLSVHLFAVFPERRPRWARPPVLAALYALGAAVIAWRQITLLDAAAGDLAALASAVMLAAEFLIDLALLRAAYRGTGSPSVRNRAKTMFVGLAATMTIVIVWQFASRVGPPLMTADRAMIGSAAFPLLIAYAMLRRNLFDVDALLRASVIYGLATALVLGVYFAAVAASGAVAAPLLRRWAHLDESPQAVAVAATLIAAALFHPARLWAQRVVDRLLLSDRRAAAEALAALAAAPPVGDLASVADDLARRIARLTSARAVAVLSPDARGVELEVVGRAGDRAREDARVALDGPLGRALATRDGPLAVRDLAADLDERDRAAAEALCAELLLPLRARGELVGLIALSPRRAGVYRYGDVRALEEVAPPVALLIDHARLAAERAARERLAALGSMAAIIVHEVKNPLGIIKVSAGTLRKRAPDGASAELARCVEEEVDRMDATCRRLLDLARPPQAELRPCDLPEVVRATVARLEPALAAAGVAVTCHAAPSPAVAADPDALGQVLVNLLHNARDSMPAGGRIDVRVEPRPGVVALSVEDNGSGMDEATRRQLFRPFFTTRHGGTGLGLAIVKRIVEEHRGAVHVDSRPGEGSRVTITLPV